MTPEEALSKLRVVEHRLRGALDRFYSHDPTGDPSALEAEALDISVPIRVMVHHVPKRSIALLSHIDPDFWNRPIRFRPLIATPPRTLPSGIRTTSATIPINLTLTAGTSPNSNTTRFIRYEGDGGPESRVPLKKWWFAPCWDSGNNQISNKDIVLAMANKEGGAHVADDLDQKYRIAKTQGHIRIGGKLVSDVVRLGTLLGTAGDELLEFIRDHFPENSA
jgi:hypothetical protein